MYGPGGPMGPPPGMTYPPNPFPPNVGGGNPLGQQTPPFNPGLPVAAANLPPPNPFFGGFPGQPRGPSPGALYNPNYPGLLQFLISRLGPFRAE